MIEKPKWPSGWPSSECYYNADGSRRDTNFKHKLISIKDVLDLPEFYVIENESKEQGEIRPCNKNEI